MNHTAHPAAPLRFAQVIGLAEAGAIDHAFHNLLGYGAAVMNQAGHAQASRECMVQMAAEKQQAGASARQVLQGPSQPLERLGQWFHLRGFDQEASNQELVSQLEDMIKADFPGEFSASQAWLRRGLAPQAALVRAVAERDETADQQEYATTLSDWVWRVRTRRLELQRTRAGDDKRQAAEANYERRALRDFHLRVLLGLNKPHEVGDLEAVDTPLALAISAMWNDDRDEQHPEDGEIVARLMQFAGFTYQRHPVAWKLYDHLQADNSASEQNGEQT